MNAAGRLLRIRWVEFSLFLLVIVTGWAAWRAFRVVQEVDRIPAMLEPIRDEYREIAVAVDAFVDESHTALVLVAMRNDKAAWQRFQRLGHNFQKWIETKRATVPKGKVIMVRPIGMTVNFGEMLEQVRLATEAYLLESQGIVVVMGNLSAAEDIEEKAEVKADALQLLAVRAHAQAGAIDLFLSGSREWFGWLRQLMVASVLTLGGLGVALAVMGYQRIVSPLQRRLVESEAVIERQQKLAHFGELAAVVAHEIRNPLTAISARLYPLERAFVRGSSEHDDVGVIRGEISRLNRIVKEFLESARPASPTRLPMTAGPLLEEVRQLLSPSCEKQKIALTIEVTTDATVWGDSQQLKQVLINLVQNAADSIGMKGTIRLRARDGQHRLSGQVVNVVLIEVEDSGVGITPEVQRRLFDPFFSTKPGGTGLGLSIAARIVDRHGGAMDFRTQPGSGTTVMVMLPVEQPSS